MPHARTLVLHPASLLPADLHQEIKSFLTRNAPCIFVHGYDYIASDSAARLPPTVGVIHSDDREHYAQAHRLGHLWNRTVAVSGAIESELKRLFPTMSERAHVIRCGLPLPTGSEGAVAADAKSHGTGAIRLVYAGRFETFQKRIGDHPKLARALATAATPYELTMVGEGGQQAAIAAEMGAEILAGRVRLPGRLDHVATLKAFLPAHVVLLLSDFEGLPLALIEGLSRGCIPIAYEINNGIPEVIEDGRNRFIVPRGDIAAAAERVARLQRDPALRRRMMQAALDTPRNKKLTVEDMGAPTASSSQRFLRSWRREISSARPGGRYWKLEERHHA